MIGNKTNEMNDEDWLHSVHGIFLASGHAACSVHAEYNRSCVLVVIQEYYQTTMQTYQLFLLAFTFWPLIFEQVD